jgi:hypothetical protein
LKISKKFDAVAKGGKIETRNRQVVPLPVTIQSAVLHLDGSTPDEEAKHVDIAVNDEVLFSGMAKAGEKIVFSPPLLIRMGIPSIKVTTGPYQDGFRASGIVDLDLTLG